MQPYNHLLTKDWDSIYGGAVDQITTGTWKQVHYGDQLYPP